MADFGRHEAPGRGTSVFDEIRRQMEDMLGGTRPPRPSVLPGEAPATRRGGALGEGEHFGLAVSATFGYWMLPIMARRRQRRRRMRARQAAEQQNTQQDQ